MPAMGQALWEREGEILRSQVLLMAVFLQLSGSVLTLSRLLLSVPLSLICTMGILIEFIKHYHLIDDKCIHKKILGRFLST